METYQLSHYQVLKPCEKINVRKAFVESLRSKSLIFFFGAGLSREYPSLCPISWPTDDMPGLNKLLTEAMIRHIIDMSDKDRELIEQQVQGMGLEQILEHLRVIVGQEALDFLNIFQSVPGGIKLGPNYRHYALALFARERKCMHFVTLNFDTFLEEAFQRLGISLIVPEKNRDEVQAYSKVNRVLQSADTYLYKLHGTLDNKMTILTTLEDIGMGLPDHKRDLLTKLMTMNDAFFIGYSDNDVDVFKLLKELTPKRCIFWHFLSRPDRRDNSKRNILEYLAVRPHYILCGEVDDVLHWMLTDLGIDEREIFSQLKINSIIEIKELEKRVTPDRRAELEKFRDEVVPKWLTREVAMMALVNIVSPLTMEGRNLRERLFATIDPNNLSTKLRHAYLIEKAERLTNEGFRTEAISVRKQAIQELLKDWREDNFYHQAICEQSIRLTNDYWNRFIRGRNPIYFLHAIVSRRKTKQILTLHAIYLPQRDVVRFQSMLSYTWPRLLHGILEMLLLWRLRLQVNRKRGSISERIIHKLIKWLAKFTEYVYWSSIKFDYGAGWKGLKMHQLVEVILHRKERVTEEVNELLEEVHWRTRPHWESDRKSKVHQEQLGAFEGLRYLYEGDISRAKHILYETYRYYIKTKHLSGKVKTLFFLALCYEKEQNDGYVHKILAIYDRLVSGFR